MSDCLWKCVAQVTSRDGDGWTSSRQVPTFYVQAISNSEASAIARDIIGLGYRGNEIHVAVDTIPVRDLPPVSL